MLKTKTLLLLCALWLCVGGEKLCAQTYIRSEKDLCDFANAVNDGYSYLNQYVYLTTDIELSGEWQPIGSAAHPFKGYFEGWGHVISNLYVDGTKDYAGLFGYIEGGSVRDVGVVGNANTTISGGNNVGGICGYLAGGEISSCYSDVAVTGNAYVGGLCGYSNGIIKNCWHRGDVTAKATPPATDAEEYEGVCAGGLVGCANGGTLLRCYVINTKITVSNVTVNNNTDHLNSYFGLIVGKWNGGTENLNYCYYNQDDVFVVDFNGSDVIIGSQSGDESPSVQTVTGATTNQMKDNSSFWNDILNAGEDSYSKSGTLYNPIWVIQSGSYPQLNSFCKNQDISFHFTKDKKWFSIVPNGNYTDLKGIKAYIVTDADKTNGIVTLSRVNTLNEGCGALVFYETESEEGEDITLSHTSDTGLADYSENLLQGSHVSPVTFEGDGTEYILKNGAFVPATSGSLARNKAYLKVPFTASRSMGFDFSFEEDVPTDIQSIFDVQLEGGGWYTLDGIKLDGVPSERGVYIYNGKKVMIQ